MGLEATEKNLIGNAFDIPEPIGRVCSRRFGGAKAVHNGRHVVIQIPLTEVLNLDKIAWPLPKSKRPKHRGVAKGEHGDHPEVYNDKIFRLSNLFLILVNCQ